MASFFFHNLLRILQQHRYRKIVLFFDNAGSQNKNITIVQACACISRLLDVELEHVFPVQGHSFNICDTNFALFRTALKSRALKNT